MDYTEYIHIHREGVKNTWKNILRPILIDECVHPSKIETIDKLVSNHDLDKIADSEIFYPYDAYFMNPERYPKSTPLYRKAWNKHQKTNPHHWQYWVLMNDIDEPSVMPVEMDLEYVIEMLCDWHSSSTYNGHTAYWWWDTQRRNMKLHPNTIKKIERYIEYLKMGRES